HGEHLSASDDRGHVLVVSVWATWCYDCEKDQPGFVNVADRYAAKGVAFLGVDPLDTRAAAQEWVRRYHVPYPSIEDPSGRSAAKSAPRYSTENLKSPHARASDGSRQSRSARNTNEPPRTTAAVR